MDFLNQICIASTVFSVGVTLLDLMSLIGQGKHDGDSSHADSDADGHGTAFAADSPPGTPSQEVHGAADSEALVEHTDNSMAHSGRTVLSEVMATEDIAVEVVSPVAKIRLKRATNRAEREEA